MLLYELLSLYCKTFLALHDILFLLTRCISPLDIGELAVEVSLDFDQSRIQTPLAIALPP
jgi:hypothetical protein